MKANKCLYSILLLAFVLIVSACQEKMVYKFDDQSSLFFYRGSSNSKGVPQIDSISYSFFLAEGNAMQDSVWIAIFLTGTPSDKDRIIPMEQSNVGETMAAEAGVHYIGLDNPDMARFMILPAGKVSMVVPIIVKRTAQMETDEFILDLKISTNDNFVEGIKDRTSLRLKITASAVKPPKWDIPNSYLAIFGPWGQEKMKFVINYVGFKDFDQTLTTDYRVFLTIKAKAKLAEYEALNGPLYEADGITRVIFP